MVGMIASRRAGKTLLAIVFALLMPILLLGLLYFKQAVKDIQGLDREITGVAIAELAYGAVFDPDHAISDADRDAIHALERKLGVSRAAGFDTHHRQALSVVSATSKTRDAEPVVEAEAHHDAHDHLAEGARPLSTYLSEIGEISGLILDSESGSYHLADSFIEDLPLLMDEYEHLVLRLAVRPGSPSSMNFSVAEAQQAYGRLRVSLDRLSEAIGDAATAIGDEVNPLARHDSLGSLTRNIKAVEAHIGRLTFIGGGVSQADRTLLQRELARARDDGSKLATSGLGLLEQRLKQRRNAHLQEVLAMVAAAAACGLLAVFLSAYMFQRMLVRLDELQGLHESAEFARRETDRINAEVASLNRELSDKIQMLGTAQAEIVRKGRMEQLGQLTATIAHELRNPLGGVRTSAFLIEKKSAGKGFGIETQLQRINTGVKRCDEIITQLLDFSRSRQIRLAEADLEEWLAQTVSEEAAKLPPQIIVECTLGLGGKHVSFDSGQLRRAIVNLMNNAAEALTVAKSDTGAKPSVVAPTLWISTFERAGEIVIRTRDNGPGIPPENLARVREPLFTTKNFGTGLGIPAVEQIVGQHGGRLEIESVIGEGACFDIILPARPRANQLASAG